MIPKFRAWHKQGFMLDVANIVKLNLEEEILEYCVLNEDDVRSDRECYFDEVVLMQSTGLKDKNGKEIFEGDILTTIEGMLYKVTKSVSGLWKLIPIEKYHDIYYLTLADVADLMMIIGNIYENPELLEVEE